MERERRSRWNARSLNVCSAANSAHTNIADPASPRAAVVAAATAAAAAAAAASGSGE